VCHDFCLGCTEWYLRVVSSEGYYGASSDNFLPTSQDNPSVPSSGFKNPKEACSPIWGLYKE